MKPPRFGTHIKDLTPEIKQQLGSNKGALIYAVIKGSPAFEADILNGDILKQIGDVSVFDKDSYDKALNKYDGREADVVIVRGGKEFHKSVKIGTQN